MLFLLFVFFIDYTTRFVNCQEENNKYSKYNIKREIVENKNGLNG